MHRWLGAALILCGGLLARASLLESGRRAQRLRQALSAAFEAMAAEIGELLTPVPALLRRYGHGEAERLLAPVSAALSRGVPLREAWEQASAALPIGEGERRTVASLGARLDSEAESAASALRLTASALRRSYERNETGRREKERLITSLCITISLFLTILLA